MIQNQKRDRETGGSTRRPAPEAKEGEAPAMNAYELKLVVFRGVENGAY